MLTVRAPFFVFETYKLSGDQCKGQFHARGRNIALIVIICDANAAKATDEYKITIGG